MLLHINRDGRLVVREFKETERVLSPDDPFVLAQVFRARVEFEEGLTSAQLFRALRPWAALLAAAAWIDFEAWLAACERPGLRVVTGGEAPAAEPAIDAVVISAKMDTWHRKTDVDTVSADFSWQTHGRYAEPQKNQGGGEDRFRSLSFANPADWIHLPLLIEDDVAVLSHRRKWRKSDPSPFEGAKLKTTPTFFDTVVLGFLDDVSFHGSPSDLAEEAENIKALMREAKAQIADD
jgi:hypothetical protein